MVNDIQDIFYIAVVRRQQNSVEPNLGQTAKILS